MILGIDQSFTSTGLVTWNGSEVVNYQLVKTDKDDLDPLALFKRCIKISDIIISIIDNTPITQVNLEGLGFGSVGNATRNLAMLQASIITRIIEKHPYVEINIIPPTTLKKFATGAGKAGKQEMYDALPQEIKNKFKDIKKTKGLYDLTDAFFLAVYTKDKTK
jgi:Holliday junction resolvasome RuvABC endonuclease subunit